MQKKERPRRSNIAVVVHDVNHGGDRENSITCTKIQHRVRKVDILQLFISIASDSRKNRARKLSCITSISLCIGYKFISRFAQ